MMISSGRRIWWSCGGYQRSTRVFLELSYFLLRVSATEREYVQIGGCQGESKYTHPHTCHSFPAHHVPRVI